MKKPVLHRRTSFSLEGGQAGFEQGFGLLEIDQRPGRQPRLAGVPEGDRVETTSRPICSRRARAVPGSIRASGTAASVIDRDQPGTIGGRVGRRRAGPPAPAGSRSPCRDSRSDAHRARCGRLRSSHCRVLPNPDDRSSWPAPVDQSEGTRPIARDRATASQPNASACQARVPPRLTLHAFNDLDRLVRMLGADLVGDLRPGQLVVERGAAHLFDQGDRPARVGRGDGGRDHRPVAIFFLVLMVDRLDDRQGLFDIKGGQHLGDERR